MWDIRMQEHGVDVAVFTHLQGTKAVHIIDEQDGQFVLRLWPTEMGSVAVRVDAEWSDDSPRELAHMTHDIDITCGVDDRLEIDDTGLFTAMARQGTAKTVPLHFGLSLKLQPRCVAAVRFGIETARELAREGAGSRKDVNANR